ncbi:hypothetical protein MKZ25_10380 [Solibacillus sp. FSL W7-1464]|uniref:hypothetical protein n=1 Tax=Solibacillus sp. FSL W7-1464 TaxID=2921706 RepID=UPI0030FB8F40
MDWLDKAAENYTKIKKAQENQKQIIKNYPIKVKELWASFKQMHETIVSKFGNSTIFTSNPFHMESVIGDVSIRGRAKQASKAVGYYGSVIITIEYINSNSTGIVHFDELLLGDVNGEPTWVYRGIVNGETTDITFDNADIEKVFKSALSIYL